VMEQRVGQRSTDALVEQDEHECGLGALIGETVLAASDAFDQVVGCHLSKVVAKLEFQICGPRRRDVAVRGCRIESRPVSAPPADHHQANGYPLLAGVFAPDLRYRQRRDAPVPG
jgi:hypothetical protein